MRPPAKVQKKKKAAEPAAPKRQYDSPLRRQQTAETRERILAAGAEIAHHLPAWDWREMTFKAVGQRAGISERTVHRYFATERALRDAILQRLVQESGMPLEHLELRDFAGLTAHLYRYLSSFPPSSQEGVDPGLAALDVQRRRMLLSAVARSSKGWSEAEQEMAAAMLDLFWTPTYFERLGTAWQLDAGRATRAITWVIGLVEQAIKDGKRP
ncbi:TetR/AcrR family transcriptional regulator [Solimonas fluminis]|jgi:AcrR family transcriptional regulator|uniref:TetR/AcrR family transcriptional regulator n=1 Tax=Solimonas fluminis TaxID=2086571 RepID=A0A2S5THV6_9GAMM|nr:TetR/AcrR family transcriptional regulator [Solimonas fluminis]PPE74398.1 TetR/AcrR family transcriptional regulator [Solimonas fluminis]